MSGLPEGWRLASFGDVIREMSNGLNGTQTKSGVGIPVSRIETIADGTVNFDRIGYLADYSEGGAEKHRLCEGDVLFSHINSPAHLGKTAIFFGTQPLFHGINLLRMQVKSEIIDCRFLHAACRLMRSQGTFSLNCQNAVNQASLNQKQIRSLSLPLPPLTEQKRIANKLDTLLARVDACRNHLARVPTILKRFRQSVLAAATSGELTGDWRIENGLGLSANAELTLAESKRLGRLRVQKSEATLDAVELFELPIGWAWVKNHRLAADESTAICAGPFGTIFKAKDFRDSGVPIIFLRHVGNGHYLTAKPGFMDEEVWQRQHQEYSVHGGELLVAKLGDPPGTACIYPKGIGVAMVTPDVMKMKVDEQVAAPEFLMHFFNSPQCKDLVGQLAFGVTRLRIDLTMFKNFPIPLPPRSEQAEIVRRVESLFALADQLEVRYTSARAHIDRLTPSLLAKAFRGGLVTNP